MMMHPPEKKKQNKKVLEEALSYRIPMQVVDAQLLGEYGCNPVCPRCGGLMDRAFVPYCINCGQRLEWDLFPAEYVNLKLVSK